MSGRVLLEPHAHTKEVSPCGWLPGAELVALLKAHGYGAVVITDHYLPGERRTAEARDAFLAGYRAAKAAGAEHGVVVLPGMEVRLRDRPEDYLVYGMEEDDFATLPDDLCESPLSSLYELAQANGWRVYQAHPFREKHQPALPSFIHGVEVFNGNPRHDSRNRMAAKFAALHQLHMIAGSDVHRRADVAGIVGLRVPEEALTPKGLAKWLAATPHPRVEYQSPPVDGIRFVVGAVPGWAMLRALYDDARWSSYSADQAGTLAAIEGSARFVSAWDDTTLVGLSRVVTDGHMVAYVPEVLVMGTYQRRGIGRELLRRVLTPYREVRQVVVVADALPQTRAFYRACGFEGLAAYESEGYLRLR